MLIFNIHNENYREKEHSWDWKYLKNCLNMGNNWIVYLDEQFQQIKRLLEELFLWITEKCTTLVC